MVDCYMNLFSFNTVFVTLSHSYNSYFLIKIRISQSIKIAFPVIFRTSERNGLKQDFLMMVTSFAFNQDLPEFLNLITY